MHVDPSNHVMQGIDINVFAMIWVRCRQQSDMHECRRQLINSVLLWPIIIYEKLDKNCIRKHSRKRKTGNEVHIHMGVDWYGRVKFIIVMQIRKHQYREIYRNTYIAMTYYMKKCESLTFIYVDVRIKPMQNFVIITIQKSVFSSFK